ncbi:MAG: hypothetical protein MPF33_06565 [Candidatus Aramenus sp.]|jgi:hypothetical protein|nr:hypothetical protein [Candidatus Aramenus sp.]
MKVKELLTFGWRNLDLALEYGVEEASYLGKTLLGLTLSNGLGLVLYLDPFSEEVRSLLLMSPEKLEIGRFLGVFKYEGGNTYFIYDIIDISQLQSLGQLEVVSVEVVRDVLEDFLLEALAGRGDVL